jgi:predicted PhzF superfamily epimerase YddE/YHI9
MATPFQVHTVRVFVNDAGDFGNPLGIIPDTGRLIPPAERQGIASQLGFSETVFVNDPDTGNVSIHNPQQEIPFAGHALLGVIWFLNQSRSTPLTSITCGGKAIKTWTDSMFTWIETTTDSLPDWNLEHLPSPGDVERLTTAETTAKPHTLVWAWKDETGSIIRARTFAADWGIPEDEANGSGSMRLASTLQRDIRVIHGQGSELFVTCGTNGALTLGGRIVTGLA